MNCLLKGDFADVNSSGTRLLQRVSSLQACESTTNSGTGPISILPFHVCGYRIVEMNCVLEGDFADVNSSGTRLLQRVFSLQVCRSITNSAGTGPISVLFFHVCRIIEMNCFLEGDFADVNSSGTRLLQCVSSLQVCESTTNSGTGPISILPFHVCRYRIVEMNCLLKGDFADVNSSGTRLLQRVSSLQACRSTTNSGTGPLSILFFHVCRYRLIEMDCLLEGDYTDVNSSGTRLLQRVSSLQVCESTTSSAGTGPISILFFHVCRIVEMNCFLEGDFADVNSSGTRFLQRVSSLQVCS